MTSDRPRVIVGAISLIACDAPSCPNRMVAGDGRVTKTGAIGVSLGMLLPSSKLIGGRPAMIHEVCARTA